MSEQLVRMEASSPDELWMRLTQKQSNFTWFRSIRWEKYWRTLLFDAWAAATRPSFVPKGCMLALGSWRAWFAAIPGLECAPEDPDRDPTGRVAGPFYYSGPGAWLPMGRGA